MPKVKIKDKKEFTELLRNAKASKESMHFLIGLHPGTLLLDATKMWTCDKSTPTTKTTLMFNVKKGGMKVYDLPKASGKEIGKQIAGLYPNAKLSSLPLELKIKDAKLVKAREQSLQASSGNAPSAPPDEDEDIQPSAPPSHQVMISAPQQKVLRNHIYGELAIIVPDKARRKKITLQLLEETLQEWPSEDPFDLNVFKSAYLASRLEAVRNAMSSSAPSVPEMDEDAPVDMEVQVRNLIKKAYIRSMKASYKPRWEDMDSEERQDSYERIFSSIIGEVHEDPAFLTGDVAALNTVILPKLVSGAVKQHMSPTM